LEALIVAQDLDIVGISESLCMDNIGDAEIAMAGFDTFRADRNLKGERGKSAIVYQISVKNGDESKWVGVEHVCCKIRNNQTQKQL